MVFRIKWMAHEEMWALEYQAIPPYGPWIRIARAGPCVSGRKQTPDEIRRGMMLALMARLDIAEVIE